MLHRKGMNSSVSYNYTYGFIKMKTDFEQTPHPSPAGSILKTILTLHEQ